jgi:hypothetical protein
MDLQPKFKKGEIVCLKWRYARQTTGLTKGVIGEVFIDEKNWTIGGSWFAYHVNGVGTYGESALRKPIFS